eukprot:jgi/Mesvir1/28193/Mv26208-RA.1
MLFLFRSTCCIASARCLHVVAPRTSRTWRAPEQKAGEKKLTRGKPLNDHNLKSERPFHGSALKKIHQIQILSTS